MKDKEKKWSIIIGCFLVSIAVVITFQLISNSLIQTKNNFYRLFQPHSLTIEKSLDLQFNSHYIAGFTHSKIYLGDQVLSSSLFVSDYALKDTQTIKLRFPVGSRIAWKLLTCKVDSPNLFAFEGLTPHLFKGSIDSFRMASTKCDNIPFDNIVPVSGSSWLLRCSDRGKRQISLAKENESNQSRDYKNGILQNQQDGMFSVDGMIRYDRAMARLIYLYYYRNQFICMDSNLEVLYRSKTIDTNSVAKINPVHITSERAWKLASPPLFVNKHCCVYNRRLYVISGLSANNENRKSFTENSVIDVYSLEEGKYRFSFYLPPLMSSKAYDFQVTNGRLIALYDHYLVTYKINFEF
jgi:hypothetical protein